VRILWCTMSTTRRTGGQPPTAPASPSGPATVPGREVDPLATAALILVESGATAEELAERFVSWGATVSPERCSGILELLVSLGLARRVSADGRSRHYVSTSLGQRFGRTSVAGSTIQARLEELERLRTDLFATIAHELRTPLTAVRTSVGLLLDPRVDMGSADRAQLLQTLSRNAERMQRLVRDVLDLARFRAGGVQLQLRRFDARALARDVAQAISPLAAARHQAVEIELPRSPIWVFGDHRRLEQALTNLVSNAEKFAPTYGHVRIAVARAGEDVTWLVEDDGPGIPLEDQPRLFERYFVGRDDERGPSGSSDGIGLGLPLALAVTQAHGGRIVVDSAPGRGSRFTLGVPVKGPVDGEPPEGGLW
jgi:signal transduction histidine kinase